MARTTTGRSGSAARRTSSASRLGRPARPAARTVRSGAFASSRTSRRTSPAPRTTACRRGSPRRCRRWGRRARGEVRARHAHGVVAPEVDHHEVLPRHVAGDAEHAGARLPLPLLLVEVVRRRVVGVGAVAAGAELVPLLVALAGVDVVAVGAAHAVRVHLALREGVPLEVLVQDLPVGVEGPRGEQRRAGSASSSSPPGAPWSANWARREWQGAHSATSSPAGEPRGAWPPAPAFSTGRAPHGRLVGPGHVARARPVAGLAAHHDLRPGGLVRVVLRVVALADRRGVAVGAHGVPALARARPVEPVAGRGGGPGVHVEPALRLRVPGGGERLQPAAGEGHEVLLQRRDAEGVGHLVVAHRAVGPLGVDHELLALPEEPPGLAAVDRSVAPAKSPSTVPSLAACMARAWFEPFHPAYAFSWQALQRLAADVLRLGRRGAVRGGRSDRAPPGRAGPTGRWPPWRRPRRDAGSGRRTGVPSC